MSETAGISIQIETASKALINSSPHSAAYVRQWTGSEPMMIKVHGALLCH